MIAGLIPTGTKTTSKYDQEIPKSQTNPPWFHEEETQNTTRYKKRRCLVVRVID